jgi:hypothetical protein
MKFALIILTTDPLNFSFILLLAVALSAFSYPLPFSFSVVHCVLKLLFLKHFSPQLSFCPFHLLITFISTPFLHSLTLVILI